ncbi:MAG: hypothetical protein WA126_00680 [Thermodesulfovibrionales bacterium]
MLIDSLENQSEENYDNFRIENISIVRKENNRTFFSLTADEIVHRKRFSKLFHYQNLKEIHLSGVKLDIYMNNISSDTNENISIPLDDISNVFASLGKQPTSLNDYFEGKVQDRDLDLLSRIIFEKVSINIHYSDKKKVSVAAENAAVHFDSQNIVFTGSVKITDPLSRKLHASKAVWSKQFNGIYFPEGYTFHNSQYRNKSFYAVSKDGDFSRLWDIPAIDYADYLDIAENKLYAQVMKKLPPYAKMMLGLPL